MRPVSERLKAVTETLDRLRSAGWKKHAHQFHVETHRFRVGTRLTEATVKSFEHEHGIALPDDYRAFLLEVGEGGAGPYYGLLTLKCWSDLAEKTEGHLALPSPLEPGASYREGWEEVLGIADNPYRGLLPIAEQGGGGYCALVVSGEARGRVVYVGDGLPHFVWDRTFLDWYERWLAELNEGVSVSQFGYTRGGTEAELVDDFRAAASSRERAEILSSLGRRSAITERAHAVLLEGLDASEPVVRAAALRALARAGSTFTPAIAAKLDDPEAAVREAAVHALSNLGRVETSVRELNLALERESSASTLFTICTALEKVNGLRVASLRPHIDSADVGRRQYAAHFFGKTAATEGMDGFERLLADEDIHVRIAAREGFSRRGVDVSRRWLEGRLAAVTTDADRTLVQRALRSLQGEEQLSQPERSSKARPWWRRWFGGRSDT